MNGRRFAIALVCWILASIGVLGSIMLIVPALVGAGIAQPLPVGGASMKMLAIAIVVSWLVLGVMTHAWIQDRPMHWMWPIVGCLAGLPPAVFFVSAWPFYISAVPLAFYLTYFHLSHQWARGKHKKTNR